MMTIKWDPIIPKPGNKSMAGKMLKGFADQRAGLPWKSCPYRKTGNNCGFTQRFRNLWDYGFRLAREHPELDLIEAKTLVDNNIGKPW